MPFDRFLIAPSQTGLQTDLVPWLIPDDAWAQLTDAYVWRGRVRKRFGGRLMGTGYSSSLTQPLFSRLRINLGNTNGAGAKAGTVPGNIFKIGQLFSIGNEIFTVYQLGAPAVMYTTGASVTHTYNTTTGAYNFAGAAINTPVFFYPAESVMGLQIYESGPINNQPSYAFDTQFAYLFTGGAWTRSGSGTTPLWHGTNANFMWTTNWRGAGPNITVLFASNFQVANPNGAGNANDDPIWWTVDGTNWTKGGSTANGFFFRPAGGAVQTGPFVETALILIGFKNRFLLLNVIENNNGGGLGTNTQYAQRCRYSKVGSPFDTDAWYEPLQTDNAGGFGKGAGFLDAPTTEQIVSAEFIKDRLIVFFERSTWEIAYQSNNVVPFAWQQINTELGAEGTFSTIPFDRQILTMGTTGVHSCNGSNVERVDYKIPDTIFQIEQKNLGVERVVGIRDYFTELVYWTFPSYRDEDVGETFPNNILVLNYRNGSWALFQDSVTFWGYFEQGTALTWALSPFAWQNANQQWQAGTMETQFRQIIAGNQEGFVYIVDPDADTNCPTMQITDMQNAARGVVLTIVDQNLVAGQYLMIQNAQGIVGLNGNIYQILTVSVGGNTVQLNTNPTLPGGFTGTYTGGGTATIVSNPTMLSKQWNPYVSLGRNLFLGKIDFCVERTSDGQTTVDYFPSGSQVSMLQDGQQPPLGTGAIMGTGVLETSPYDAAIYPFEQFQDRLWHSIYFQTTGEFIQIKIAMSDAQITTPAIAAAPFVLEGLVLYTSASSSRLQ